MAPHVQIAQLHTGIPISDAHNEMIGMAHFVQSRYVYVHTCMYRYVGAYVYVHVCMCIYVVAC
jgi:hypothetical protein